MQNKITLFGLLCVHLQATEQQYHAIFHIFLSHSTALILTLVSVFVSLMFL